MEDDEAALNKMVREFIEGWDLLQVLGEGTFAEVKLLVNRDTGEACAMKEINIKGEDSRAEKTAKKEICVHKLLKHPNIVQCYGSRIESERQFIFLEYCSGGELFDRIGKCTKILLIILAVGARKFKKVEGEKLVKSNK